MPPPAPPIYTKDVVAKTTALLRSYTDWNPSAPAPGEPRQPDFGEALIQIFGHLAGVVIDRLNEVPNKNFLAFLDLVGVGLLPPVPARVPLTFQLAPGVSGGAVVPAGTRVAAEAQEGESEPVVFETERDLFAVASQLVAVYAREPGTDLYAERSDEDEDEPFSIFEGTVRTARRLYLGSGLLSLGLEKDVAIRLGAAAMDRSWPTALVWDVWNGERWQRLVAHYDVESGVVSLPGVSAVPPSARGPFTASWLRATSTTTLPRGEPGYPVSSLVRRGVTPDSARSGLLATGYALPRESLEDFTPFLRVEEGAFFALACEEAFSKPGAEVTLRIRTEEVRLGRRDMVLDWEYSTAGGDWSSLTVEISADARRLGDGGPTRAFLDDGEVRFVCPENWAAGDLLGTSAFWLRVRVVDAAYTAPSPPRVSLSLDYQWELPQLEAPTIEVESSRAGLLPEQAFANQTPVDLHKSFFPFGAVPSLDDTLYVASDEAFGKPSKEVTIAIEVTNADETGTPARAKPSTGLAIAWEFWDGEAGEWRMLGLSKEKPEPDAEAEREVPYRFADTTNLLADSGTVSFDVPPTLAPVEVNGELRHWIRARILRGDYGHEARFAVSASGRPVSAAAVLVESSAGAEVLLEASTLAPPSIRSLRLRYVYAAPAEPFALVLTENDFRIEDRTARSRPGSDSFRPFETPADAGPTLYLGFDAPFPDRAVTLYFSLAEVGYTPELFRRKIDLEPPAVAWEYWNGETRQWARLAPHDETRGFARSGLVTFIGPPALTLAREFDRDAAWLRARWERGGYPTPPIVRRILRNTTWAANATTVEAEILGSSTGEPDQVSRLTATPVLEGELIEVRETELPSKTELEALTKELGADAIRTVRDESGRAVELWVRWVGVRDFYASGPRSRHYVLDRGAGEVRFGNGQRGMIPPQGTSNIRAARYRRGGGAAGNRAAGTITQLKSAVPYVDGVTNWGPAYGGASQESIDDAIARGPQSLRHGGRAVTVADFEDLGREASTEVARVWPVPVRPGGPPGQVGLVVVPRSSARQPVPDLELLSEVEKHVRDRMTPTFSFWVGGPGWLEVTVDAEVVPEVYEDAATVEADVLAELDAFLHPLTGGVDRSGWPFGRRPHRSDIQSRIESVPGVDHVRALWIRERLDREAPAPDAYLVFAGAHEIVMVLED